MNHRAMLFLIPLLMLVLAGPAGAQTAQKTGFVNSAKIFQELPEAKEAEKKLESYHQTGAGLPADDAKGPSRRRSTNTRRKRA